MIGRIAQLATMLSLGYIGQVMADVRHYQASLDDSKWVNQQNARLSCRLEHSIPRYGKVVFSSVASRATNMTVNLDMLRTPHGYDIAKVLSVPPSHRPGTPSREIIDMQLLQQFDGELIDKPAWTMLSELEKGMSPTFYYKDWYSDFDHITVGINAANFHQAYESFLTCVDNLLPFNFDDISLTVLTYQSNKAELTKNSKKRLAMIAEYLKQDAELDLVLLDGFSDSYGGRWHNEQLAKQRAENIRSFFTDAGVDASRIEVDSYGERRHIATNQNVLGRAKNRRVVIRMERAVQ
ncbi:sodium-type flagellar protein MotY [Catenovulum agarivorans DS-2]|uniref:Sodium-type flagellar protein MotY n=1 Tax=Catenovulum agarivorans DS-2 TaxID=1328313 RepID=W7QKM7_9ALTE|nr:OmpA family protein [Catenovulum agarivorans]EWH09512.1 sodium-type flagellar protein MotY [Catenovulum agarivorans DS-2]